MSESTAPAAGKGWSTNQQAENMAHTSASADDAAAVAEIGECFEKAWRPDQPPAPFGPYLPPPGSALRPAILCDLCIRDLDLRFLHGLTVRVEDYLERYPELQDDRAALLDLVQAEYDQRRHREPGPDFEEYRRRFPTLADDLSGRPAGFPHVPGFTLEAELGRGGMGIVYKAKDHVLGRTVALKMIRHDAAVTDEQRHRFRREAEAVARLRHPNIIQIHHVGEHDDHAYLAFEYVEGGSLEKQLDGTPWPARPAAQLVETLARAIEHCHGYDIIHRDLKPANILMQRDEGRGARGEGPDPSSLAPRPSPLVPTPKIADFGLAKRLGHDSAHTASGAVLGTPSYMAPEQADGKSRAVTPATDVYALGAILYELLTGRPPFKAETPLLTLKQVVEAEPVRPRLLNPAVPRDLETICLKCLQKEPAKRFASALTLAEDLHCFRERRPIRARPTPWWERMWRWCRRNPGKASSGAVVAATLCFLVILLVLYLHNARLAAARAAAARGEWRTALGSYESLIHGVYCPGRTHLEVERLPGFLAVNDRERFAQQVQRLAARDDLGADTAQVKLLLGEFYLCQPDRQEEARRLIDEALAAPEQLSESDRAYAQALISRSSNQVTALLQDAVERSPFHHRAHRAYLMARVMRGEFSEARQQAALMRKLFPDDPLTDYAEALLAILEGDRAAGLARLAPLERKLGPDARAQVEQYVTKLADLFDNWNARALVPDKPAGLRGEVQALRDLTNPGIEPLAFNVPTAALLIQTLGQLAEHDQALAELRKRKLPWPEYVRGLRELSQRLAAVNRESPEALFPAHRAMLHADVAQVLINAGRFPDARQELQTMQDLAEQATTAPSLLPHSPVRYQARTLIVLGEICQFLGPDEPTPERLWRFRENCTWLTTEHRWRRLHPDGVRLVTTFVTLPLTEAQLAEWHLNQPAHKKRYDERREMLYEYGRRALTDLWQDDPKNPQPLLQLAEFELKVDRPEAGLRAAQEALARAPGMKEALALEQRSLEALRKRQVPNG